MRKLSENYKKLFRSAVKKRALLRLACNQPEVITGKNEPVIDVVLQMAADYANTVLEFKETSKYE